MTSPSPRPFDYHRRLDDSIHTLEGIVRGIALDGQIDASEVTSLTQWLQQHQDLSPFPPFREFAATITQILADGKIDDNEKSDLLWLLARISQYTRQYREVSFDLRQLLGLVRGVAANGVIHEGEVAGLRKWLANHAEVADRWPCSELATLLDTVTQDGRIEPGEQQQLLSFLQTIDRLQTGE
ncbi:MAG: hypothetical protein U1A77_22505 [Pirellulales bacterium]